MLEPPGPDRIWTEDRIGTFRNGTDATVVDLLTKMWIEGSLSGRRLSARMEMRKWKEGYPRPRLAEFTGDQLSGLTQWFIDQIRMSRLIAAAGGCEHYGVNKDAPRQREHVLGEFAKVPDESSPPFSKQDAAAGHSRPLLAADSPKSAFASLFEQWQSHKLSLKQFLYSVDQTMIQERTHHQLPEEHSITANVISVLRRRQQVTEEAFCYRIASRVCNDNNITDPDLQSRVVDALHSVCSPRRLR